MKTGKLDKRHNGHSRFRYFVSFGYGELSKFVEVRNWCWQNWGPSAELDIPVSFEQKWAWIHDSFNTRIYLATDAEYQWFILKWK